MTREHFKDVLEGVGLFAVIASLIFVGIETRNGAIQAELNTEALEMAAYQQLIASINDMNALMIEQPQLRDAIRKVGDGQNDLTDEERSVYGAWVWMRIRHGDMAFFQYQRGTIEEMRLRSALAPMIGILRNPYSRSLWQNRQNNLVPEFRDYVNTILDEIERDGGEYVPIPGT
jgi:hypothetical protein